MSDPRLKLRFAFTTGPTVVIGPSLRASVVSTLFHIGYTMEQAKGLWRDATTDIGPDGDGARQLIEQATDIAITIEPPLHD
jgi:hypothetical protein